MSSFLVMGEANAIIVGAFPIHRARALSNSLIRPMWRDRVAAYRWACRTPVREV